MLVAYLVVVAAATLMASAAFVTLFPLMIALLSGEPASALPVLGLLAAFGLLAGCFDFTATLLGQRAGARLILRMHELIAGSLRAHPRDADMRRSSLSG
jgi:ATP-binding cassette subfamily B protein IrtB